MVSLKENKLIYVGDPMCSWCYGFANELRAVKAYFQDQLSFEMVMGGLRPYNTQKIAELKSFLTEHWEHVERRSGQTFRYGILENSSIAYDTEPPSRAFVIIRKMMPEASFEFFSKIQEAFYYHNRNMHLVQSYYDILDELNLDKKSFEHSFANPEMKTLVESDFKRALSLGVRSFPTLLLQTNRGYATITQGYTDAQSMINNIQEILAE